MRNQSMVRTAKLHHVLVQVAMVLCPATPVWEVLESPCNWVRSWYGEALSVYTGSTVCMKANQWPDVQ